MRIICMVYLKVEYEQVSTKSMLENLILDAMNSTC